ncbi:hypothetical protein PR048_005607 [Dryococelus australis]|uniref:Uncharacterized protein n=1 Tax=Dryococelus australis TaxID=614101 RepID=A0ABQ9I8U2_9NEOP|nr:hypothetical protein PR048_005607 [Dryococelus australis]
MNDDFDVFEDFIGLYEASSTTGDTVAAIIEDVLLWLDLPIEDCREELARNLQTSDISITSALRQTEIVMGCLTDLRIEEKFTELWKKVKKRGEELDLQPNLEFEGSPHQLGAERARHLKKAQQLGAERSHHLKKAQQIFLQIQRNVSHLSSSVVFITKHVRA